MPLTARSPFAPLSWLTAGPAMPGSPGPERFLGAASLANYSHVSNDFPLLVHGGRFVNLYLQQPEGMHLVPLHEDKLQIHWLDKYDRELLDTKKVDVLLSAPDDSWSRLDEGQPALMMEYRDS